MAARVNLDVVPAAMRPDPVSAAFGEAVELRDRFRHSQEELAEAEQEVRRLEADDVAQASLRVRAGSGLGNALAAIGQGAEHARNVAPRIRRDQPRVRGVSGRPRERDHRARRRLDRRLRRRAGRGPGVRRSGDRRVGRVHRDDPQRRIGGIVGQDSRQRRTLRPTHTLDDRGQHGPVEQEGDGELRAARGRSDPRLRGRAPRRDGGRRSSRRRAGSGSGLLAGCSRVLRRSAS